MASAIHKVSWGLQADLVDLRFLPHSAAQDKSRDRHGAEGTAEWCSKGHSSHEGGDPAGPFVCVWAEQEAVPDF